jgi:hypothetical protein
LLDRSPKQSNAKLGMATIRQTRGIPHLLFRISHAQTQVELRGNIWVVGGQDLSLGARNGDLAPRMRRQTPVPLKRFLLSAFSQKQVRG